VCLEKKSIVEHHDRVQGTNKAFRESWMRCTYVQVAGIRGRCVWTRLMNERDNEEIVVEKLDLHMRIPDRAS
jgi:hypothetical protein